MSAHPEAQNGHDSSGDVFGTSGRLEAAMSRSIRQALRRHKLLGESIAVSRDGKVVILSPEEIPDFPEDDASVR
jgi:hypothetical protein